MVKNKDLNAKSRSFWREVLIVGGLLLVGLLVRVIGLGSHPTFISDEASIGYNAYSILKTGRDEWGQLLPLTFKAFGEYKLPGYIYATVPFVALFGLSEFSVRLVSALSGVVGALFFYLLVKRTQKKADQPLLAYLSLFFYVINPWLIQTSRLALEANLALALFLAGFWLIRQEKKIGGSILWALTFYTYNACRVFVPLFLIGLTLLGRFKFKPNKKVWLVLGLAFIPLLITGFRGSGERIMATALWRDPGLVARIGERRVACQTKLPFFVCRLAHNRPVGFTAQFAKNYLSHFSPNYLFLKGAGLAQYGMPEFGATYLFEWVFILVGLGYLLVNVKSWPYWLVWLVVAPVANSITGSAHPVRSLMFAPLLPLASALGASYLYSRRPQFRQQLLLVILVSMVFSASIFLHRYFFVYPLSTGSIWQEGYEPLFEYLDGVESRYNQIQLTKFYGEPHIFYLFHRQVDPAAYQNGRGVVRYEREDQWVNVDQIGKYFFYQDQPQAVANSLIVSAASELEGQSGKVVYYSNGQPAFQVWEQNL